VYIYVDWGASYWRQKNSLLSPALPEPSLVVYDTLSGDFVTGRKAANTWLPNSSKIRFDNLKALFDESSDCWVREERRIRDQGLSICVDEVLEAWWTDRLSPLLERVEYSQKVVFAVAHPAHFSPQSAERLREYFARTRRGRTPEVILSEESTAALHGSRHSGFKTGDIVLVVDGGKSTIVSATRWRPLIRLLTSLIYRRIAPVWK
jgi:hypothetical protein